MVLYKFGEKILDRIDEVDGQEQHETERPEQYLGQIVLYKRDYDVVRFALDRVDEKCGDCKSRPSS